MFAFNLLYDSFYLLLSIVSPMMRLQIFHALLLFHNLIILSHLLLSFTLTDPLINDILELLLNLNSQVNHPFRLLLIIEDIIQGLP